MRPKTSVRPVIAKVRRQHLTELLRRWRRQPRKRSPLLFWTLLSLALLSDSGLLFFAVRLLSVGESSPPAERRILVPYAPNAALWEPMRHWVVRVDGRLRLFESFCRETVSRITGEERFEGHDPLPVVVSWMLDDGTNPVQWDNYPCLRCDDTELRVYLYREGRYPSRMTAEEQIHGRYVEPAVVRSSLRTHKPPLDRKTAELGERLKLFDRICGGCVDGGLGAEMQTARAALSEAYHSGDADLFAAALSDYLAASQRALRVEETPVECRRLAWESWLQDYTPARYALYLSLLAATFFAAATIRQWHRSFLLAGRLACLSCLGCSATAFLGQAIRDGTPPIGDGCQAILLFSALVMALGLFLAVLFRDGFLALTGALVSSLGLFAANRWSLALTDPWSSLPRGAAADGCLPVQLLLVLPAYAALALAWGVAVLTLARILFTSPSFERMGRLATLCIWPIRVGVALLAASALLDCYRIMQQGLSSLSLDAQEMGTLLFLPGCTALIYARRCGWLPPFRLMAVVVVGFAFLAAIWYAVLRERGGDLYLGSVFATDTAIYMAGLLSHSLAAHAALRFYFGKQGIVVA
ncbi:MAG TPA: hypothetical protein VMF69_23885 [Gemmataceae bacterium]|nr:hypothetical protein [Gemmataceae bacterium]